MTAPAVSVILPVYNGAADLPAAIACVLSQTFTDFELICIDDGSTDASGAILDAIADPRARVIHQQNKGLAATLNVGIGLARGRYIARQDQDDIMLPTRLEKQVAFLDAHPDCALLGTWAEIWVGDEKTERAHDHPTGDSKLKFALLFNNSFVHSSVMLRKSALDDVGGYSTDRERQPPEDYELWSRVARKYRIANLPERLTIYREVPSSMSRTGRSPIRLRVARICAENLAAAAGEPLGDAHRDAAALVHGADEALSGKPDIDAMCRALRAAGAGIAAETGDREVVALMEQRVAGLRSAYRQRRFGLHRIRPFAAAIARRLPFVERLRRYLAA